MSLLDKRMSYSPFEYPQAYKYWELQQQSHWLHCVSSDQRVCTSEGLITVKELFETKKSLILFNNEQKINSSPMLLTGHRQLVKIHTEEGYTHTVTPDHRVMTNQGWIEAQNLKKHHNICIQTNEGLFGNIDDPDLAYLAGHYQGDGSSGGSNLIWRVWEHEYDFIPKLEQCLFNTYQKLNLIDNRYPVPKFGVPHDNSGRMPSKSMTSLKMGGLGLIKKNVVPDFIWKGNKETVIQYLIGLYDTDGTCYQSQKHESIKLTQCNLDYLRNIQLLLINFGIKGHIYKKKGGSKLLPSGKNMPYKYYDCNDSYTLEVTHKKHVITLNNFTNIFEKCGKKFRGFINEKKSHPIINARFKCLEKLEEEEEDVYCVSVNLDNKAWICNGFITHNTEISMASDINDWKVNLNDAERNVIGHILKGFTQSEVFIQEYWGQMVAKWFKKPEIQMMAACFSNMESVHAVSYAFLNQSLGLEDFDAFLHEPTAKAKIDRLIETKGKTKEEIARSLAIFSAFNEGVNLFSSFAILLNPSRKNKMKGLGQIIAFSIKDESLHSEGGIYLFNTLISEFPEIWTDELKQDIYESARLTVELEDNFIDKAFSFGDIEGISAKEMKNFIRHRTNTKLEDLGLKKNWKNIDKELLKKMEWFDVLSNGISMQDFFSGRVSDYSKGSIDFSKIWD